MKAELLQMADASSSSLLLSGLLIGLTAGLNPGPTTLLILRESLVGGLKGGTRVSLMPLLADLPIAFSCLAMFSLLSKVHGFVALISMIGAMFLIAMAKKNLTLKINADQRSAPSCTLREILIAAITNPNAYLFWLTVGGPIALSAWKISTASAITFILARTLGKVMMGCVLAVFFAQSGTFLQGRAFLYAIRGSGGILVVFAVMTLKTGLAQW
jgi:threonine/homoserine/homoserine lactone efflux protein